MTDRIAIRRALLSVSDKTGLVELGRALARRRGRAGLDRRPPARAIAEAGLAGDPGRTGHRVPRMPGRPGQDPAPGASTAACSPTLRLPAHVQQIAELGIEPFELVVVNLYPFRETVASGASVRRVRRADRHRRPGDDPGGGQEPPVGRRRGRAGPVSLRSTMPLPQVVSPSASAGGLAAGGVRAHRRLRHGGGVLHGRARVRRVRRLAGVDRGALGQGAAAAVRREPAPAGRAVPAPGGPAGITAAEQLHGKEMSYNNYVDVDAAWRAANDFTDPAVRDHQARQPVRHRRVRWRRRASPWRTRRPTPATRSSAFGGVIAVNRPVTAALAEQIAEVFTEVLLAPASRTARWRS